jgi:hypothetical protein
MVDASTPAGRWCRLTRRYNSGVTKPGEAGSVRPSRWRTRGGRAVLLATGLAGAGIAAALLGGGSIGGSGDAQPPPVSGAPKQVVATIMELERALAQGDFATICGNLFTREAREAAGGDRCPSVLQETAGGLRNPDVRIVSISVRGNTATAIVRASVAGGRPVTDTIRLQRQGGRYRIVSAGQQLGGD